MHWGLNLNTIICVGQVISAGSDQMKSRLQNGHFQLAREAVSVLEEKG